MRPTAASSAKLTLTRQDLCARIEGLVQPTPAIRGTCEDHGQANSRNADVPDLSGCNKLPGLEVSELR